MPGRGSSNTKDSPSCTEADEIEACVLQTIGCQYGCSGKDAQQLLQFVSCLESPVDPTNIHAKSGEGSCFPYRASDCATASSIDYASVKACRSNKDQLKDIQSWILNQSENAYVFPQLYMAGNRSMSYGSVAELKQGMCHSGVQAACSAPSPAPEPSSQNYKCKIFTGRCVAEPNGKYGSEAECEAEC